MISHVTRFINLSKQNFLIVPTPQEDELLSSWLVRIALAHDTLPWSFYNMHFPEYKNVIFSRDVDVWAPKEFLEKLALKCNKPYPQIYKLTLRSDIGKLFPSFNPSGANTYFTYLKKRGRSNKLYGQKYCPSCLKEDLIPYFRKQWRYKISTNCIHHQIKLLDRCPSCYTPISFYKFKKNGMGFIFCWNCNYDLQRNK